MAVVSQTSSSIVIPGASLYVGDLHVDVTENDLYAAFNVIDHLVSVRVCKDSVSSVSLGYGYVNYISTDSANLAIEKLNHTPLRGKMIRVMWSRRDSDARKSGIANLFVKNLSISIDNAKLHEMFSKYGKVLSCKVAMTEEGKSKGYGFVQYETEESATAATNIVNGSTVEGKQIYVGPFVKKSERPSSNSDSSFTNIYIKNLDFYVTEELLTEKFSKYGKITHLVIMKDDNSKSKGFGFVNFDSPDEAKRAMEATNGMQIGSKVLYVGRAQKKAEREKILHDQFERRKELQKFKASNVYVKNIDDSVNDDELRSIFSKCGTITSAKIMLDEKGISKGFGFVCFTTIEAAYQAVNGLHGYMLHRKPLYVAFAQKKEERRTQLQIQFSQGIAGLAVPTSAAVIPARYPPPLYYTLPPNMVPAQGLMHQPFGLTPAWGTSRFLPPARPNFHSAPRPVIPDSSRQNKKKWGRMNAHMVAQTGGQSVSFMPHIPQATPRPAVTVKDPKNQQIKFMTNVQKMGEMKSGPQQVSSIAGPKSVERVAATSQPLEGLKTLSTMLAAASPQHQKLMLGECLYPLVYKLQRDLAPKITGMLLEMDNSELLLLLESPASLVIKVEQAVQVLKNSKTTRSSGAGQDSLHPNYMSTAQVAVN